MSYVISVLANPFESFLVVSPAHLLSVMRSHIVIMKCIKISSCANLTLFRLFKFFFLCSLTSCQVMEFLLSWLLLFFGNLIRALSQIEIESAKKPSSSSSTRPRSPYQISIDFSRLSRCQCNRFCKSSSSSCNSICLQHFTSLVFDAALMI